MGKIRCVRIPTREMERFFTRRTLAHARGNIIIRARFQRCYPRCLFHRVATKKASSSKYIYIYTERVTHVEKERRLELRGGGGGAATCLNLVNKPVRMFPPRATSEVLLLPTYLPLLVEDLVFAMASSTPPCLARSSFAMSCSLSCPTA